MKPLAGRRLVFLSSSTGWGGLEQNLLRHARWMAQLGADVRLCAVPDSPLALAAGEAGEAAEAGEAGGTGEVEVVRFDRQPRYFPGPAARKLARRLQGTELVWARDPRDLAFAGLLAQQLGAPFLFQQGMQIAHRKRAPWHRIRYGRVTCWVSPLEHLRREVLARTPLRADRTRVIPLSLADRWFEPPLPAPAARSLLGLPESGLWVGLFGRIDPLKGQDVLIRALAEAPGWQGLVVGAPTVNAADGYAASLHGLAQDLGVADRLHWLPPREDLRPAYAALDAFALCSASETFGMVTLEALASGCWVLGTESGGTPELLASHPGTACFPPGDASALAALLRNLGTGSSLGGSDPHSVRWSRPGLDTFRASHVESLWVNLIRELIAPSI